MKYFGILIAIPFFIVGWVVSFATLGFESGKEFSEEQMDAR